MTGKIIEGLWDCPYCGADKIGGLKKYCPDCGHPQSKDTVFYVGEEKHYLTEEELSALSGRPDWMCEYCTSLNNAKFKFCKNCGAERTEENKDYHELHQETVPEEASGVAEVVAPTHTSDIAEGVVATKSLSDLPLKSSAKFDAKKLKKYILPIACAIAVIAGIIALAAPRSHEAIVNEKSWERSVEIEEYRTVEESCWDNVPSGGRLLDTKDEIRSYASVLSHYETKTREYSEQVLDGYDIEYYYEDNGDGTFTEHSREVPRYRTEYHTETYEEPVYVSVPVYDTKYYYEIERWVHNRTEESSGVNIEPYWPEYTLDDDEREGTQKGEYTIEFYVEKKDKVYEYDCENFEEFESYELEDRVSITVTAGTVTEIER